MKAIVFIFVLALAPMGRAQTAQQKTATLAEQKMCDEQAGKKFRDEARTDGWDYEYTSHYDASATVCYVMITEFAHGHNGTIQAMEIVVKDAFEGRSYATFVGKPDASEVCWLAPRDRVRVDCDSESIHLFYAQVTRYFNIAP